MNRRPSPPVIPPPKYWNAYYRSCAGRPDVEEWFAGYDAGLERGSGGGVSQFHEIYLNRTGCGIGSTNPVAYGQPTPDIGAQMPLNPAPIAPVQAPNSYGYPEPQFGYPGQ